MNHIRQLHEEAMDLAEMALIARLKGDLEQAVQLSLRAYKGEAQAARLMSEAGATEPTRSVFYRSAASLALNCNEFREAERLIAEGLAGNPPEEIAEELRELYQEVSFHQKLEQRHVFLEPDEIIMSLAGRAIGFGTVAVGVITNRLDDFQRLIRRTVERKTGKPYVEGGSASELVRSFELFVTGLKPGSFIVSLKISNPQRQQLLSLPSLRSDEIIDEILACIELLNADNEEELRRKIPDPAYYRNFVGITKKIAPDREEVDLVGFATPRRMVELTKTADELGLLTEDHLDEETDMEAKIEITGTLRYANAMHQDRQRIRLIDENNETHYITVPEGMMSDIVKPLWDEKVTVRGFYRGQEIQLEDIRKAA